MAKKNTNISYLEAITELQEIVAEIENSNIDVDQLLEKTKRAAELIEICKGKLHKTEFEVNELLEQNNN